MTSGVRSVDDLNYRVPIANAAGLIGRSARTIRRWVSSGQVPVYHGNLVELDDLARVRNENAQRMTRQVPDDWVEATLQAGDSTIAFTVGRLVEALWQQSPDVDWSTLNITGGPGGRFHATARLDRLDRTG